MNIINIYIIIIIIIIISIINNAFISLLVVVCSD